MKNEMPVHTDNIASIPYTYKSLPKKLMEESHKVDNKFLNNHLGEIEEAVDKKLIDKTSFIKQQRKYHEKSGILNHDNFFHCDLATGTPISNDNFHHSNFVINPYTEAGCDAGADLATYTTGGSYSTAAADRLILAWSSGLDGTIGECYDQVALQSNNTTGEVRLGVYNDDGAPDVLYASTGSIAMTSDYAFKSLTEFTLTSVKTWLAYVKDVPSQLVEKEVEGFERYVDQPFSYAALPNPAGSGYDTSGTSIQQQKIGHS